MKRTLLIAVAVLTLAMFAWGSESQAPTDQPSVIIWYEDWGLGTKVATPQILVAIWNNGHLMWSTNTVYGGAPYLQGRIAQGTVQGFMDSCQKKGFLTAEYVQDHFGPDSWFTGIYITSGTNSLVTRSWHEVAEQNPEIVAASYGLTGLDGQSRENFLKKDKAEYQKYRTMWTDIRTQIADMLPRKGDIVENVRVNMDKEKRIPTIGWTVPVTRSG